MTEYHYLINRQAYNLFFTAVCRENEYGKSGHLSIFTSLKQLMMLLKCNISGLNVYTLSKIIDSM